MMAVGLRLIYSTIFETPSLFVGFIGAGLTVFCILTLIQEFRNSRQK